MIRCPRCSEDNPEHARFCLACGLPLGRPAPEQPAEERRLVTVVFVDLVGSTAHGENLDPEDIRARLVPYYERVRDELERFGGTVEKFIGDAVVAIFGAPIGNEDDPERAVRASLAVRDAVAALTAADAWLALKVRVGVATGEALVRLGVAAGETTAMGDVMNTAARIQSAAPVGGILVGSQTRAATRHAIDYRASEPVSAKGKSEPVEVWEAVGLRDAPARRHSDSPFVGRRRELDALAGLWRRVREDGRPASAVVVAEPGTGKTRLLAAFAEAAGAPTFWGRCLAYGNAGAYAPVAEILAAAGARSLVERDDADDELRTVALSLDAVLGPLPGRDATEEEITRGELHWGLRRALELAAAEPIVVVFEDLHWADPALLELIDELLDASAPILVLCSARPGVALASLDRRLALELPPLTPAESRDLAGALLGGLPEPEALEPVFAAARGNPLYLEETVRMLADEGLLEQPAAVERVPAPPSLTSMIGARLDRLPEGERHVALRAAVVGSSFWPGAVASLNGSGDVEGALERLSASGVAEERPTSTVRGEREFAFKHELFREVAYARLPKGLRAELHVRSADWLAARQERDEYAEIGAYHLEQACRLATEIERSPVAPPILEATRALRAAAEKAERREGLREADGYYARALELVVGDDFPEVDAQLRVRRARVLAALGNLEEAAERFRSVAVDSEEHGWPDLRGEALVGLGNVLQKLGGAAEARMHVAAAKDIAGDTGNTRLEVTALFELAELDRDFSGDVAAAVAGLERALELAAVLDDRHLLAEGELRKGFLLGSAGKLVEAEEALVRSAAIGSELGSRRDESRATFLRAWIAHHRGRFEEAEARALEAQEWFERTGDSYFRIQNLRSLATFAFARGDAAEAERRLQEALGLAEPSGGWLVSDLNGELAELYARTGRLEEAVRAGDAALAHAPDDDPAARAVARVASAYVAAVGGDADLARSRAEEALEILGSLGNALELARARVTLGEALALVGEPGRAAAELRLAGDECIRMGATTLLAQAEGALAKLDS